MNQTWDVEQMHYTVYTPTTSNAWKGENLTWYANVEVSEEEHDATVAYYWDEERGWNDYLFQGILPDEITDKLKAYLVKKAVAPARLYPRLFRLMLIFLSCCEIIAKASPTSGRGFINIIDLVLSISVVVI
nr:hypothetical protein Iba_chr11cCG13650 [Ipomoea batatas]